VQPVPKAAYRIDFRENRNFFPQRDSNLGSLAQQASVLPLDHCDLWSVFRYRDNHLTVVVFHSQEPQLLKGLLLVYGGGPSVLEELYMPAKPMPVSFAGEQMATKKNR